MISRDVIRLNASARPLGDVVEFLDSQRRPVKESDRKPGPYPYYGANGQQGTIDSYLFDEPLVLLAEDGGFFDQPDRGVAYRISGKTWVNNHAHVLRPRKVMDVNFLCRILENYHLTPFITGTTRGKLTKAGAEEILVPVPPLDKQRRIAAILDQADDLRRKRRGALRSLDSLSEVIFSDQFGNLVENEKGWAIEPLAATIENFEGGKNIVADGDESGNPARVLKISAIQADGFDDRESKALPEDYEPPKRHFVQCGDLLLSRANTTERVGLVALVDHEVDNLVLPDKILRFIWRDQSAACVPYWLLACTRFG